MNSGDIFQVSPPFTFPYVYPRSTCLEPVPLPSAVDCESNIRARNRQPKQHKLHKEPAPAPSALSTLDRGGATFRARCCRCRIASGVVLVEIERLNTDDVVVIGELARLGGETDVGNGWDLEVWNFEALGPLVFSLVLQVEFEGFILEVGEPGLGGDLGVADTTSLVTVSATTMGFSIWGCLQSSRPPRCPFRRCPCRMAFCRRRS